MTLLKRLPQAATNHNTLVLAAGPLYSLGSLLPRSTMLFSLAHLCPLSWRSPYFIVAAGESKFLGERTVY